MSVWLIHGLLMAASLDGNLLEQDPEPWVVIDDVVMGGRSSGSVAHREDRLIFEGRLSLENNGGFSSIRRDLPQGIAGADAIAVRVKGDGRVYQLRLRHGDRTDGVSWRTEFRSTTDWTIHTLPLADFEPVFRGRPVPGAGPVRPAEVRQLGILLADKTPGDFRLEVAAIAPVRGKTGHRGTHHGVAAD